MAVERTLSIVKPDGVRKNVIGEVYRRFETAGLRIVAARMRHLSQAEAEGFYAVHRERPFFKDLVAYMISGPVIVQVLEGDNAVAKHRDIMGATDPKKAPRERRSRDRILLRRDRALRALSPETLRTAAIQVQHG
jgi:nucleoside-diphosphate kinase